MNTETAILTQHDGLIFLADEAPFEGARFARLDLKRRRVISWHRQFPTPAYSECGSHKAMRKAYEAKHGQLAETGEFPYSEGKLWDCVIKTQKNTYTNSLFGGQTKEKAGWKYGADGVHTGKTAMGEMKKALS